MSWLGSLASSLLPDSSSLREVEEFSDASSELRARSNSWKGENQEPIEQRSPRRRAKEDLSEFTKALSGKLWGVASFLVPPSSSQTSHSSSTHMIYSVESSQESGNSGESGISGSLESSRNEGIRGDFAEIGGSIKTGISRLSNKVAIKGISKIAFTFLPFGEGEEEKEEEEFIDVSYVIGVTDEVLAFAKNIACHPETWLDFPLLSDDEDFDDFDMSIAQQDHALVIESLAPRLAALRIELCPAHMSIGCFWKIYFALLHPRLKKPDSELLSTPQIEEARSMLQNGLKIQSMRRSEGILGNSSFKVVEDDSSFAKAPSFKRFELEKHSIVDSDEEFVDKFVVKEEPYPQHKKVEEMILCGEDDDEWPEDVTREENSTSGEMAAILAGNEEDITFSDLEEDDDGYLAKQACGILHCKAGSPKYL